MSDLGRRRLAVVTLVVNIAGLAVLVGGVVLAVTR